MKDEELATLNTKMTWMEGKLAKYKKAIKKYRKEKDQPIQIVEDIEIEA